MGRSKHKIMKILTTFLLLLPLIFGLPTKSKKENQVISNNGEPRMMGLDTGNDAADFEAGIWLLALVGTLAAAVPVAFLNPSLGFKKKRSIGDSSLHDFTEKLSNSVNSAISKYKVQDS